MSANKFKVGDKVEVRKGLVADEYYGNIRCSDAMAKMGGKVLTIRKIHRDYYEVRESEWSWGDQMLKPAKKHLDNLCAGDLVGRSGRARRVLAAVGDCYLLSNTERHTIADEWYTASELAEYGFGLIDREKTIEIDGKKYNKADVEKAIEDLEPIE